MSKIKVLLTDDHQLIRDGLQSMFEDTRDIEVVGSVSSGEEAVNEARSKNPDVILMDIVMGGITGIEATRWIKDFDSKIKVIVVTMEVSKEYVSAAIRSGVDGYLPKNVDKGTLLGAIREVYKGGRYFNDAIKSLVFEDYYLTETGKKKRNPRVPEGLTDRENEVLELAVQGFGNKEISERLFISVRTVEAHKTHILDKLGLKNTVELIKYAIRKNIISID